VLVLFALTANYLFTGFRHWFSKYRGFLPASAKLAVK